MNFLYFKSDKGNFGDDLNPWLWPKIFKSDLNKYEDSYFLGIGSILHAQNKNLDSITDKRKIVFGTGIRPANNYRNLKIDSTWDIRFLRGPLSAQALGNQHEYITDAAYAVRQLDNFHDLVNTKKKYEISIMPYFHSVEYFDWEKISKDLGYHYISPYSENGVEHTLKEIASSKYLISEAMHGAILADVLRVPWKRFVLTTPHTEGERVSDFKWRDWLNSVGIYDSEVIYTPFYKNARLTPHIKRITGGMVSAKFLQKSKVVGDLKDVLKKADDYSLSSDFIVSTVDQKIHDKIVGF
ncbi:hypothetical protein LCGC14_0796160 [marine sediment metagenome]|uniref:Polysaccharide pyruvyl transferase n=2 Tax=root TaxID=1 RepID=A0A831VSU9_9FLAO|nr:polysaccharide pyruvyl transferase [Pricia sp.]HEA23208.1 polysaccharide pyruvyl transferase [Pricia antarctica]